MISSGLQLKIDRLLDYRLYKFLALYAHSCHIICTLFAHSAHSLHMQGKSKDPFIFFARCFHKIVTSLQTLFSDILLDILWGIPCTFIAHERNVQLEPPVSKILFIFFAHSSLIFVTSLQTLMTLLTFCQCKESVHFSHTLPTLFGHSLHMEGMCKWSLLHILCIYFAQSFHIFIKSCRIFRTCKECGRSVQWEFFACIKFLTTNP